MFTETIAAIDLFATPVMTTLAWLGSAVTAGFLASGHCVAMCGGIALGIEQANRQKAWWHALMPHAVRITLYAVMGAALYGVYHQLLADSAVLKNLQLPTIPRWLPALGLFISALALGGAFSMLSARFPRFIAPTSGASGCCHASNDKTTHPAPPPAQASIGTNGRIRVKNISAQKAGKASSPLTGWLKWGWGLLPCPMVMAMLILSANAPSALMAAFFMAAFGLGSLPSLLGITFLSRQIKKLNFSRWFTRAPAKSRAKKSRAWLAPALLCLGSLWTLSHGGPMGNWLKGESHGEHSHQTQPTCHSVATTHVASTQAHPLTQKTPISSQTLPKDVHTRATSALGETHHHPHP